MRRTGKAVFLGEMERVVPWADLLALVEPDAPKAKTGRPPFAVEVVLRIHFLQQWFGLSDVAMQEALFDVPLYRQFAGLGGGTTPRIPDRVSILRFRPLLERHNLAEQMLEAVNTMLSAKGLLLKERTAIDATLIAAPSSTKSKDGKRGPRCAKAEKASSTTSG